MLYNETYFRRVNMSYQLYIGSTEHSYTYNLRDLFEEIIQDTAHDTKGIYAFDSLTGYEALPLIKQAFRKANSHEDIKSFDAPNGWGTANGALLFLARFAIECAMNPYETINVTY
jgi:hypothetical protein